MVSPHDPDDARPVTCCGAFRRTLSKARFRKDVLPTKKQFHLEVSMKPFCRILLPVVVLLLVTSSLLAQGTITGNIVGTVTSDGKPLPGVAVTIASPGLQGSRSAVSREAGGAVHLRPAGPAGDPRPRQRRGGGLHLPCAAARRLHGGLRALGDAVG